MNDEQADAEFYPVDTPLGLAAKFLGYHFDDVDSWDEAVKSIEDSAKRDPAGVTKNLSVLEEVISTPQGDNTLAMLVAWAANWGLEDPSDEGAREWLTEVAEKVRAILGAKAPPR